MKRHIKKHYQPIELEHLASLGVLPLRLMSGLAMLMHGLPKMQDPTNWMAGTGLEPAPGPLQALAAFIQVAGGVCWMLGFGTAYASLGIFAVMAVGVLKRVQADQHFVAIASGGTPTSDSFEVAALYICVCLLLLTTGPGRFSLDARLFGHRAKH